MAKRSILRQITGVLGGFQKIRLYNKGFHESLSTDSWSAEQIHAFHDRKIKAIVQDAARNIPFYKKLYNQAGVDIDSFSGVDDLHKLPTISKKDILTSLDQMVRPGVSSLKKHTYTTGGSTGTIGTLVAPRGLSSYESGCIYSMWRRIGVTKGDRTVLLRGALLNEGRDLCQYEKKLNRLTISTYHLSDKNVDEVIKLIDDFNPKWLHVYASAATLLANILNRTGKRLTAKPSGILCGSENVSQWQVELFAEIFGCRSFSHYGHGEMGVLAGWCKESQMYHFLPNHGYLELLDENQRVVTGPDVTAEMTSTGYLNPIMPLIRYRTADYGAWSTPGPCPACGREHQRLSRIDGRIQEYLILADGTKFPVTNINALHGTFFSKIYRFQFVQDTPGKAVLRFVPAYDLNESEIGEVKEAFAFFVNLGLDLEFQSVENIPLTSGGKQRVVITSKELPNE